MRNKVDPTIKVKVRYEESEAGPRAPENTAEGLQLQEGMFAQRVRQNDLSLVNNNEQSDLSRARDPKCPASLSSQAHLAVPAHLAAHLQVLHALPLSEHNELRLHHGDRWHQHHFPDCAAAASHPVLLPQVVPGVDPHRGLLPVAHVSAA